MELCYVFWKIKNNPHRYYLGKMFNTIKEATAFKNDIIENGFEGEKVTKVDIVKEE